MSFALGALVGLETFPSVHERGLPRTGPGRSQAEAGMSEGERPEVRRTERLEIVDEHGRVRGVFGRIDRGGVGGPLFGLEVRDAKERPRATLAVGDDGAWMLFELAGNARIHLGVNDPASDAVGARVFLYLCDDDGRPVAGWRVRDDGSSESVRDL